MFVGIVLALATSIVATLVRLLSAQRHVPRALSRLAVVLTVLPLVTGLGLVLINSSWHWAALMLLLAVYVCTYLPFVYVGMLTLSPTARARFLGAGTAVRILGPVVIFISLLLAFFLWRLLGRVL
jgi:hypothetical protein